MSANFDLKNPLSILGTLGPRLDNRQYLYARLNEYYDGEQPLSFIAPHLREELNKRIDSVVINWPSLIVNSIAERMNATGFVIPSQDALTDQVNDIWQRNNMDEQSAQAIIEKLIYGHSFGLVWGDEQNRATISIESPRSMIAYRDPRSRKWVAAIKRWVEEDGRAYAFIYTPTHVYSAVSKTNNADVSDIYGTTTQITDLSHVPADGWNITGRMVNPLGELPVVIIPNRPRLLNPEGVSELADVLPLADAVNKLATDMLVTSEFYSGPRRWATGVELEEDENGDIQDGMDYKPLGRMHLYENAETKTGQYEEAELEKTFIAGIDALSKYIAATKKIPAHYMDPAASGLASAEAVRAAEAPLVVLARREQVPTGGAFEQIARLALMVETGDLPSTNEMRMETVWSDTENLTDAQKVDAATKRAAIHVPIEQLWKDAGYTEQQIEDMKKMRAEESASLAKENENVRSQGNESAGSGREEDQR